MCELLAYLDIIPTAQGSSMLGSRQSFQHELVVGRELKARLTKVAQVLSYVSTWAALAAWHARLQKSPK